ncbi:MAG TPA: hypothetical protein VL980_06655 [Gemmatimonadaceae bacterium]|nr:hypothetical protein [Gemmatimonadaceae bacterium]
MTDGFDPSAADQRDAELARRLASAVQRMGAVVDSAIVAARLMHGSPAELFALLRSEHPRVARAAHECAMLRHAYIVAVVAQAYRFDAYERDDLVQRVFVDLPAIVRRAYAAGRDIPDPEGWLRRRAHLMAREFLRQESGRVVLDAATGEARRNDQGRVLRTRGERVDVETIEELNLHESLESKLHRALEVESIRKRLHLALADLERELPLGAEILRQQLEEGRRLDQIAATLGRAHGTIRNDALRARRRLRAIIRERYPDLVPLAEPGEKATDAIA